MTTDEAITLMKNEKARIVKADNCGARMDAEKVFYENEHQKNIGGKAAGKKI